MRRLFQALARSPFPYSIALMSAYLLVYAPASTIDGSGRVPSLGATAASCDELEDGSCKVHNYWVCNIGGGDHEDKCKVGDTGC